MKISKIHQRFSDLLKEPRALTNPEDFLGPNWEDVINFWLYVDGLSYAEKQKMGERFWALDGDVITAATASAVGAAEEVVDYGVSGATWDAPGSVFAYATYELIGYHKIIEQGKSPTFLPLCVNS
jgi:hypothetical protein